MFFFCLFMIVAAVLPYTIRAVYPSKPWTFLIDGRASSLITMHVKVLNFLVLLIISFKQK